jgi:hypothetical protein
MSNIVSRTRDKVKSEVVDPVVSTVVDESKRVVSQAKDLFSSPSAAADATNTATSQANVKIAELTAQRTAEELQRRRRPLLTKGRQSTILAGSASSALMQTGQRKTLLGG